MAVPERLRPKVGKREIQVSLGTSDRTIYLHPETLNLLDPLSAAPVYIFIDEASVAAT
jgi:hypothetical protein